MWDHPLGRGQAASLGSSQELFAGSGSRCAAAEGLLHTQLWGVMQCLVPFLSSLCRGGRQCVHRDLCLWRWPLDTCFPLCLSVTRFLTLLSVSKTSDSNWSLFVRGADR